MRITGVNGNYNHRRCIDDIRVHCIECAAP